MINGLNEEAYCFKESSLYKNVVKDVNLKQFHFAFFKLQTNMLCRFFKWNDTNINFGGDLECLK